VCYPCSFGSQRSPVPSGSSCCIDSQETAARALPAQEGACDWVGGPAARGAVHKGTYRLLLGAHLPHQWLLLGVAGVKHLPIAG
jgi:hypothetical protein